VPAPRSRTPEEAFTLIEVMLVVGIMGLVLGMGIPMFVNVLHKEPMRKAVTGVVDASATARAQAILQGKTVILEFHPGDGSFAVAGGGGGGTGGPGPARVTSGKIEESIVIEMLDVNLLEFRDKDVAKVRFFPNGTCDEFTLILHSDRNEWVKIAAESTTGIVTPGKVQ
jgi:Tfp pilus assembly protein FimT